MTRRYDLSSLFTKGFLCLIAMALDGVMRFPSVKTSTLNFKKISPFIIPETNVWITVDS